MEQPDRQFNELFQQLKQEDQRHAPTFAPTFARVVASAAAHSSSPRWQVWRFAAAAFALLLGLSVWFAFFRRTPDERMALPVTPPSQVVPLRESPPQVAVLPKPSQPVRHARPRPHKSAPSLPLEALISQWHSPTEFLLRKPGTALLNTVPRLGESFIKSKTLVPEQHNYLEEQ